MTILPPRHSFQTIRGIFRTGVLNIAIHVNQYFYSSDTPEHNTHTTPLIKQTLFYTFLIQTSILVHFPVLNTNIWSTELELSEHSSWRECATPTVVCYRYQRGLLDNRPRCWDRDVTAVAHPHLWPCSSVQDSKNCHSDPIWVW